MLIAPLRAWSRHTSTVDRTRPIERDPEVLWRSTLRGVLVAAPGADEPVLLTTPGDAVWDALDAPCRFADLVAGLAHRFVAGETQIAADIEPLLDELLAMGVIRFSAQPEPA